jgi:alpha-beta hydrolase superfamily lysophospholipase
VIVRGAGVGDEEAAFVAAVLEEIRTERHVTDEQVERELALAAGSEAVERGPQNWPWVRAVLRAMDKHLPLTSAASVALATRDVYLYLRNIGIRDRIETGVRAALQSDAPMVVVGHSLGSVVTYNLLHREGASQGWQVPLYVTVGSPLAVSAIKKLTGRPRHPSCAARWFNAMDPRDVVALHPLDSDHFRVDPLIHNKTDVDNPTENRHGITGYLGDPEVAQHIHTALTQS